VIAVTVGDENLDPRRLIRGVKERGRTGQGEKGFEKRHIKRRRKAVEDVAVQSLAAVCEFSVRASVLDRGVLRRLFQSQQSAPLSLRRSPPVEKFFQRGQETPGVNKSGW
jgi:hypothetical protein